MQHRENIRNKVNEAMSTGTWHCMDSLLIFNGTIRGTHLVKAMWLLTLLVSATQSHSCLYHPKRSCKTLIAVNKELQRIYACLYRSQCKLRGCPNSFEHHGIVGACTCTVHIMHYTCTCTYTRTVVCANVHKTFQYLTSIELI